MAFKKGANAKRTFKPRPKTVPKAVKSYVNKKLRSEIELKKFYFNNVETPDSTTSLNAVDMVTMVQGTGISQRVGNEVKLQGLHIKGVLHNNSTDLPIFCRTIVLYTKDELPISATTEMFTFIDGTSASATSVGLASGSINTILTPLHKANIGTVLYDSVTKLGPQKSADGTNTRNYSKFIKLHGKKMHFANAGTSGVSSERLFVINFYADATQDFAVATIEHSRFHTLWYTDA